MKTFINLLGIGLILAGSIIGEKTQKPLPTFGLIAAGSIIIVLNLKRK